MAARAVSTSSVLLALIGFAFAGPYSDFDRALASAQTPKQIRKLFEKTGHINDDLDGEIQTYLDATTSRNRSTALDRIKNMTEAGEKAETMPVDKSAESLAASIKASTLYRDERVSHSNWWGRAMESFANWLKKLFDGINPPQTNLKPPAILGPWMIYVMWGILGSLVIFFLALAARHFKWKVSLKRRSKALLEEDEPERTLDEWLERAKALEAEGKYREAVRCLYLACLLRFDEARVARFDRGQTNWEHLHRIQQSPALPPGLDFQAPTQAFDRIWYGMIVQGTEDVRQFHLWYGEVTGRLMEKAA